jgi:thiopeptide-type bacteriocin biosynthesis protein
LTTHLDPWLSSLLDLGTVRAWFFVRYADNTGPHLRLRVFGDPSLLWSAVLPGLRQLLSTGPGAGLVSRWEIGTYEREVERYGGFRGVELAEELFAADSVAVLEALRGLNGAEPSARWLFALRSIQEYFDSFDISLEQRRILAERWSDAWLQRVTPNQRQAELHVASKFREHRPVIEAVLGATPETVLPTGVLDAIQVRSGRIRPVVKSLRQLEAHEQLTAPVTELVESFVHMSLNRIFPLRANVYEAVTYEFLVRHYRGRIARRGEGGG